MKNSYQDKGNSCSHLSKIRRYNKQHDAKSRATTVLLNSHVLISLLFLFLLFTNQRLQAQGIPIVTFDLPSSSQVGVSIRNLLPGEIPGVRTDCISIVGPAQYTEPACSDSEVIWFFVQGSATLQTKDKTYKLEGETIARAPLGWPWDITVSKDEKLLAVRIHKELSDSDRVEIKKYPENNTGSYVKKFSDCTPYKEAIKSPKTVSRTLLDKNVVPRMAAGTVETSGPDQVGAHKHPMLEQLFLGLNTNDCILTADADTIPFPQFSLLHIPLGSMHGVHVEKDKRLYYVWMDFFGKKEGQEWLKMHTPINDGKTQSR